MAINDEIAAGGRPVQFENPLNNMVKMFNIRNDMQTNQMNQMKMDETQRAQAQAEDTRNFFRTPGLNIENMNPAQKQMLASKNPELFEKLMTQQSTQRTQESETAKRAVETRGVLAGHYADEFSKLTNPQEAASLVSNMYDNVHMKDSPIHGVTKEQALARIPQDVNSPEWLKYIQQNSLNAKDYGQSQLLEFRDMGDATQGFNKTSGLASGPSTAKGMTPKEKLEYTPKYLAEVAERDRTANDIKKTEALYNNASGTPMREVYGSQLKDYYTRLENQDKRIAGMKSEEAELKRNPDAKLAAINDYYARINNGEDPNSPSMKVRKGQIDFNQTRPEPTPFMVLDKNGNLTAVDKRTILPVGTLKGVGKPQQNIVQFGPDGLPIQDKALPAHAIEVQAKNRASIGNIVSTLQDVATNPSAFGYQNMLPEAITQHLDPAGVTARANVANIGSLKLHDRSGANVTVGEVPRLRPFIPNITYDDAPTIAKKLQGLQREIVIYQAEQDKAFAAQGYNIGSTAGTPPPAEPTLHKHPKTKGRDTTNPLL